MSFLKHTSSYSNRHPAWWPMYKARNSALLLARPAFTAIVHDSMKLGHAIYHTIMVSLLDLLFIVGPSQLPSIKRGRNTCPVVRLIEHPKHSITYWLPWSHHNLQVIYITAGPGAHFANDSFIVIEIWWKFSLSVTPFEIYYHCKDMHMHANSVLV